jgi:hypothetical protein
MSSTTNHSTLGRSAADAVRAKNKQSRGRMEWVKIKGSDPINRV